METQRDDDIINLILIFMMIGYNSTSVRDEYQLSGTAGKQRCQLYYGGQCKCGYFYEAYEVTLKKMYNKVAYYKETAECRSGLEIK
jgi:hypothetical protein